MPDDLEGLANNTQFQRRFGMQPTGPELSDLADKAIAGRAPVRSAGQQAIAPYVGAVARIPFDMLRNANELARIAFSGTPYTDPTESTRAVDKLIPQVLFPEFMGAERGAMGLAEGTLGAFGGRGFGTGPGAIKLEREIQPGNAYRLTNEDRFHMVDASGNRVGIATASYDQQTKNVYVGWSGRQELGSVGAYDKKNVNKIPMSELAGLIPELKRIYGPDLFTITARRVSGARKEANTGATGENSTIMIREPRTPDEHAIAAGIREQRRQRRERAIAVEEQRKQQASDPMGLRTPPAGASNARRSAAPTARIVDWGGLMIAANS